MEMLKNSISPYELAKFEAEESAKLRTEEAESASAEFAGRNRHERRAAIAIECLEMRLPSYTKG